MSVACWRLTVLTIGAILGVAARPVVAQSPAFDTLQRQQEAQQRAKALTRDLLTGILDVQLRQFDENGLSDQKIYRDISLMRQNLNHLVDTEMSKVVDLLADAQQQPQEKQQALMVEARQQLRTVVRQLSVERQHLLKRLKVVELAEQVRRLLRQQVVVQTATKGLSGELPIKQEALTLKTIDDQRDVKELYLHLIDTLEEMKSWSGLLATAAGDGLRIVNVTEIPQHLDRAGRELKAVKYAAAHDEQALVIKGLQQLLKIAERAQGTFPSEQLAVIERVRTLREKQTQLRDETKKLVDEQPPSSDLVDRQAQLQKEIVQLQELVTDSPKALTHIQQAETAAFEAAAHLLDNHVSSALADQGRVSGNLVAIEQELTDQTKQQSRDKSADELAQTVNALATVQTSLTDLQTKQAAIDNQPTPASRSVQSHWKSAADIVQRAINMAKLPSSVEAALTDAEQAASLTAGLKANEPIADTKLVSAAKEALDRAKVLVDAVLMDARRQEAAVKIGELARAAEVLERLAAEERAMAKVVTSLTDGDPSLAAELLESVQRAADRQAEVIAIADKLVQATAQTAATAAACLIQGTKHVSESQAALLAIVAQKAIDPKSTQQAAQRATDAAQQFADAAKEIRQATIITAQDLIQRTATQADQLAEIRTEVEKVVGDLPSSDKLGQLEAAQEKLGEARQQQARAQGQPAVAVALQIVKLITLALDAQDTANVAAASAQTAGGSELKAAIKQEEVAETCQTAAEAAATRSSAAAVKIQDGDSLTTLLHKARQAASEAARQTLDGDQPAAAALRQVTDTALKKALVLAQAEAVTTMEAPPSGQLDQPSQANASTATAAAQALIAKLSTAVANDLASAVTATRAADQALRDNADSVPAAQETATSALRKAEHQLDVAIQQATAEQALALAQRSTDNRTLAKRIAAVEPAAADAVNVAAKEAEVGSKATDSPRRMADATSHVELALEHAVANLGAKEQDVRRDQAIAESMAHLVQNQQTATQTIAEQAAALEQSINQTEVSDAGDAARRTAAKKLNDAQQQFVHSLRATGQGAVELSGQKEVANPPLRAALQLAANLPGTESSADPQADAASPEDRQITADEQSRIAGESSSPNDATSDGNAPHSTPEADERQRTDPSTGNGAKPGQPNALGTGFIPQSPQLTAEMMAGPKAQQAAQKALEQRLPPGQRPSQDQQLPLDQPSDSQDGQPITSENANSSKLTKKEGSAAINQQVKGGAAVKQAEGTEAAGTVAANAREKEEALSNRRLKEESWFAKLPPELRKSIRAGAGQKPPRAYEERLKKYFQSVD